MNKYRVKLDIKIVNSIVFVILGFMYFYLAIHKNFSYDESYTIGMIDNTYLEILNVTLRDVHSPLYYWVLKVFCQIIGRDRLILSKFFSCIFMLLFLFFGRKVCRKHYGCNVEFYWLLCAGFMPSMIIQATTVRMYTMALFFMTVTTYLAYNLYLFESRNKWIGFTILSVISVYLHTFCMLQMVVVYVILLLVSYKHKNYHFVKKTFVSGLVVSACYLPWLMVLWRQFSRWAGWEKGWSNTIEEFSYKSIFDYLAEWFSSLEEPGLTAIVFGVLLIIITGTYTIKHMRRNNDYLPCLGVVIITIIIVIAIGVSVLIVPCFLGRYVIPMFGGLWLFVAVGLAEINKPWIKNIIVVFILVFGLQAYIKEIELENSSGLNSYLAFMEELEEGQIIMADTYYTMMLSIYLPEAEYMIWGSAPECLPFRNYTVFTDWEQLENAEVVWYISLSDFKIGSLQENYEIEKSINISYSYYDLVIEKYVR